MLHTKHKWYPTEWRSAIVEPVDILEVKFEIENGPLSMGHCLHVTAEWNDDVIFFIIIVFNT